MSVVFDHDTTLVTREPKRSLLPFVTVLTMAGAFRALATPEANAGADTRASATDQPGVYVLPLNVHALHRSLGSGNGCCPICMMP